VVDCCVVHHRVHPAEPVEGVLQEAVRLAVLCEVGRNEGGPDGAEFTRQGLASFTATAGEEYSESVVVEPPGGFGSYAGGGTRDQSHP
jgi:hypothetical protein